MSFSNMCAYLQYKSDYFADLLLVDLFQFCNFISGERRDSMQVWQENYCVFELILCP